MPCGWDDNFISINKQIVEGSPTGTCTTTITNDGGQMGNNNVSSVIESHGIIHESLRQGDWTSTRTPSHIFCVALSNMLWTTVESRSARSVLAQWNILYGPVNFLYFLLELQWICVEGRALVLVQSNILYGPVKYLYELQRNCVEGRALVLGSIPIDHGSDHSSRRTWQSH